MAHSLSLGTLPQAGKCDLLQSPILFSNGLSILPSLLQYPLILPSSSKTHSQTSFHPQHPFSMLYAQYVAHSSSIRRYTGALSTPNLIVCNLQLKHPFMPTSWSPSHLSSTLSINAPPFNLNHPSHAKLQFQLIIRCSSAPSSYS